MIPQLNICWNVALLHWGINFSCTYACWQKLQWHFDIKGHARQRMPVLAVAAIKYFDAPVMIYWNSATTAIWTHKKNRAPFSAVPIYIANNEHYKLTMCLLELLPRIHIKGLLKMLLLVITINLLPWSRYDVIWGL